MTTLETQRLFEGVMYTAYGDESHDEKSQRVFAIAGLFGDTSDWETFKPKWIERTDGKTFHASDCECNQGDYKQIANAENKKLYADLAKIIANSNLLGLTVTLSLPDYQKLLAPLLDQNPYYICFQSVIIGLVKRSRFCIPRDRVEFTFDRNHEIEYNAGQLYDRVMSLGQSEFSQMMEDKISFASRATVGIQAADLVAREAMKLLDNQIGPQRRDPRISTKVLAASGRIEFCPPYTKKWCEEMVQHATRSQYPKSAYYKWIKDRGLPDQIDSRLKFEIWHKTALGGGQPIKATP